MVPSSPQNILKVTPQQQFQQQKQQLEPQHEESETYNYYPETDDEAEVETVKPGAELEYPTNNYDYSGGYDYDDQYTGGYDEYNYSPPTSVLVDPTPAPVSPTPTPTVVHPQPPKEVVSSATSTPRPTMASSNASPSSRSGSASSSAMASKSSAPVGDGRQVYKLVIVGGGGVGKSALTIQFIQGTFVEEYDPTIEDSYRKQVLIDNVTTMIDLLDTAGQEEYATMRDTYIRRGEGFLLTYSLTSRNSFDEVKAHHNQILRVKDCEQVPMVLCANKADLENQRQISESEGRALAKEWGGVPFFEASAFNRQNVDACFFEAVREVRRAVEAAMQAKEGKVGVRKGTSKKPGLKECTLF